MEPALSRWGRDALPTCPGLFCKQNCEAHERPLVIRIGTDVGCIDLGPTSTWLQLWPLCHLISIIIIIIIIIMFPLDSKLADSRRSQDRDLLYITVDSFFKSTELPLSAILSYIEIWGKPRMSTNPAVQCSSAVYRR